MRILRLLVLLFALLLLPVSGLADTIVLDMEAPGVAMSQTLYGLFFEDINYAADGGLYAELLRNRSFENRSLTAPRDSDSFLGWMFNHLHRGEGNVSRSTIDGLNAQNPTYMRVRVTAPEYRIVNFGYATTAGRAGVPVVEGTRYRFFAYFRNIDFSGTLTAGLTTSGGAPLSDTVSMTIQNGWAKYEGRLTGTKTGDGVLCLTVSGTGAFDLDMASLMPEDCFGADWLSGGLRSDLVSALSALRPRFLRFPGGCVAEGSFYKHNVYHWKDTIGPVESRRENPNTWGYMQSYGVGFDEYFRLCEALGAEPLPVVQANLLCQARDNLDLPYTPEERAKHIQDVLDLIEYANGGADTIWGAQRIANGHPAPYGMRYLAIGNENWGSEYFYRYGEIRAAVKEKYPDIICIVAAGPVAEGALIRDSWAQIRSRFPNELVDEHYYMDSDWFLSHTNRYDSYSRGGNTVFLGEYAAHEPEVGGRRPNSLYAALCEAAYLTGVERNADIVQMCCYAPLLARNGMTQWTPDLIWFDASRVLLTPNYYVQKMFAETLGETVISTTAALSDGLYQVCTRTATHVYVKLVNVSGTPRDLSIQVDLPAQEVPGVLLTGDRDDCNSFDVPSRVAPIDMVEQLLDGALTVTLPGYCAVVYTLSVQ